MGTRIARVILAPLLISLAGCASVATTVCEPQIYGGARFDAGFIMTRGSDADVWPYTLLACVDILPSTALDTLFLLYTVPYELTHEEHEKRSCFGAI